MALSRHQLTTKVRELETALDTLRRDNAAEIRRCHARVSAMSREIAARLTEISDEISDREGGSG